MLRRKITIRSPGDVVQDAIGHVKAQGDGTAYVMDAMVEDLGGRDSEQDVALIRSATRRFRVVNSPVLDDLNTRWTITDEDGEWSISSHKTASYSPRFLLLFAEKK